MGQPQQEEHKLIHPVTIIQDQVTLVEQVLQHIFQDHLLQKQVVVEVELR